MAYASRAHTETEKHYSHIEKEAIAIHWGCRHFHLYMYGHPFVVHTYHKPLILLFQGSASKPHPRIEKSILQLQEYSYTVEYRPGASNPADFLSRHPRAATSHEIQEAEETEEFVRYVVERLRPRPLSVEIIKAAAQEDECLQLAIQAVNTRKWDRFKAQGAHHTPEAKKIFEALYNVRNELTVTLDGHLLRDHRLVIPHSLTQQVVQLAHVGHQGMVKTKNRICNKVWFPHRDSMVEETVRTCHWCQSTGNAPPPEPVITEDLPTRPWACASLDFGSLPDGRHTMVIIDNFSKYPVVEILRSLTAGEVILNLDKIMATHGLIQELRTDNGPPFQSQELAEYLTSWDITHKKITPRWPQANGEVERFMRTLNKVIRIAHAATYSVERSIYSFLREYRQTPHTTTGVAPSHVAMGRVGVEAIPHHPTWTPGQINPQATQCWRRKTNEQASLRRGARASDIQEGDRVLLKDWHPGSKFRLPFETRPWKVTRKQGTMVTACQGDETITRNIPFFKKYHHQDHENEDYPEEWLEDRNLEPTPGSQLPGAAATLPEAGTELHNETRASPRNPLPPEGSAPPLISRGSQSQYQLRENPRPSGRLRDYALGLWRLET